MTSSPKRAERQTGDGPRIRVLATNRRAPHDFEFIEKHETGVVLTGAEVKSLRAGQGNLVDSYALIRDGEVQLHGAHIPQYDFSHDSNYEAKRPRRLLMHRKEIDRLMGKVAEQGLTLVPLRIYLKDGLVKIEIALSRGKREYDKRASLRDKEQKREMARALKERGRTRS